MKIPFLKSLVRGRASRRQPTVRAAAGDSSPGMRIPYLDLHGENAPLRKEFIAAIARVIDRGAFTGGHFVEVFGREWATFCGTKHTVGVASGTDAIALTLAAAGVGPDDEVITVPSTFMATVEAISCRGAKPVFVDINPHTYNMDPGMLERAISSRTRAVIPVHLFGQMADMDPILAVARKYGLVVIEDACHAHGAEYRGSRAGSIGHAGCFSFFPGKNLGGFGEAGAVTTNDADLARRVQLLSNHGMDRIYHHAEIGWNAKMDGIQAAVLRIKLRDLVRTNSERRRRAGLYAERLAGVGGIVPPVEDPVCRHVYHHYVVRVKARDAVLKALAERGIECRVHYPIPVHLQRAYRHLGLGPGSFPVAERCAQEFLSLPLYPELRDSEVATIAHELKDIVAGQSDDKDGMI